PSFSIRTAIMSKRSATGRRDIFALAPAGGEGRGEEVTSESDFRDAVVVDEGADRFEQIVAFRLELGGLVDDRPPMAPDLPQAQGGIFDREGRAGFGQGLEIGARAGAPVLPGIAAAGHTLPEDILEIGRALVLVEERAQEEMGADGVAANLEQAGLRRV